nr:MAG TPA: hypothetical protein [Caudoviricetes sp.]
MLFTQLLNEDGKRQLESIVQSLKTISGINLSFKSKLLDSCKKAYDKIKDDKYLTNLYMNSYAVSAGFDKTKYNIKISYSYAKDGFDRKPVVVKYTMSITSLADDEIMSLAYVIRTLVDEKDLDDDTIYQMLINGTKNKFFEIKPDEYGIYIDVNNYFRDKFFNSSFSVNSLKISKKTVESYKGNYNKLLNETKEFRHAYEDLAHP